MDMDASLGSKDEGRAARWSNTEHWVFEGDPDEEHKVERQCKGIPEKEETQRGFVKPPLNLKRLAFMDPEQVHLRREKRRKEREAREEATAEARARDRARAAVRCPNKSTTATA